MSDSEGDFSDELLELAGATEKKRRKRQAQHKTMKRRRSDAPTSDTDSEDDASAGGENDNPYPLEGKYLDEDDRARLLDMAEVEREVILAQRQEEMQRFRDKRNLDALFKSRTGDIDENVAKAAKRQHAQRGATKEKSKKLDELREKRRAKGDKKPRNDSPKRDRSSSPMDMETSDEEEEDGQINKFDEYDDRDRGSTSKAIADDKPAGYFDLLSIVLTRKVIAKHCESPWFDDLIKGAWLRYCIGMEKEEPVYRACEIVEVAPKRGKPYKLEEGTTNKELILRHGKSEKNFVMNQISNNAISEKEFSRVVRVYESEKLAFPTIRQCEKKAAQIQKLTAQILTEADVAGMVGRKAEYNQAHAANIITKKSKLLAERRYASLQNNEAEVARLDEEIQALGGGPSAPVVKELTKAEELARLNEQNRRANIEAALKAEKAELERKRRERKLAGSNGTATPDKIKLLKGEALSRAGTPGTPPTQTAAGTPRSASPTESKPADTKDSFEDNVLDTVELDLGDF